MRGNSNVSKWMFDSITFCMRYIAPVGILIVFIAGLL